MHRNLDNGGTVRTDAARHIAAIVFGNTSRGAIGIVKQCLRVEHDGRLVAIDHEGKQALKIDDAGHLVLWDTADLVQSLRTRYVTPGAYSHRTLAALLGLRNGQLAALLRSGHGPVPAHQCRRGGGYYVLDPKDLRRWIEANQQTIAQYRAVDTQALGRRH